MVDFIGADEGKSMKSWIWCRTRVSWADVAMDTSTDAYKVRREMEGMFAPALPLKKMA